MKRKQKPVDVPFNARDAKTQDLIDGLYRGYSLTFYALDAVNELIARGEQNAIAQAAQESTLKWTQWAIKKAQISK